MAITVHFDIPGMTREQYDRVMADLGAAGASAPSGRLYHVASPQPNGWYVVDVWTSEETLGNFAGTLFPILAKNGVEPPNPRILPTHNVVMA